MRKLIETLLPWAKLRRLDRENWQMREALGYSIPYAPTEHLKAHLAGLGGHNPFKCGRCDARAKNPHLFGDKAKEIFDRYDLSGKS